MSITESLLKDGVTKLLKDLKPSKVRAFINEITHHWYWFLIIFLLLFLTFRAREKWGPQEFTVVKTFSMQIGNSIYKSLSSLNETNYTKSISLKDLFFENAIYDSLVKRLNLNTIYISYSAFCISGPNSEFFSQKLRSGPSVIDFDKNHNQIIGSYIKIKEIDSSRFLIKIKAKGNLIFRPNDSFIKDYLYSNVDTSFIGFFGQTIEDSIYKFIVYRNNRFTKSEINRPIGRKYLYGYLSDSLLKNSIRRAIKVSSLENDNRIEVTIDYFDIDLNDLIAQTLFKTIEEALKIKITGIIKKEMIGISNSLNKIDSELLQMKKNISFEAEQYRIKNEVKNQLIKLYNELDILNDNIIVNSIVADYSRYQSVPNIRFNYILALFFAVLIPISIILARSLYITKIKGRSDLTRISSIPILGIIYISNRLRRIYSDKSMFEVSIDRLKLKIIGEHKKVFMFTSSVSGEGKSFLSQHLAISLANKDTKVILVDFDLRRPSLQKFSLTENHTIGLGDYLIGKAILKDIIYDTKFENLKLILSGSVTIEPIRLLETSLTSQLIDQLKEKFDYVIIDSPPLSLVADSNYLLNHCDIALLVVKNESTTKEVFASTLREIDNSSLQKVRIVLNYVDEFKFQTDHHFSYYKNKQGEYEKSNTT